MAHLGPVRRVRFIEERPDFWLRVLPSCHLSAVVLVLKAKLLCNLLVRRLVRLDVQLVEDGQGGLGVPVGRVRHPAAGLDLQHRCESSDEWDYTIFWSDYRPGCCQVPKTQVPPQREVHKHLRFDLIPILSSSSS